MDGVVQALVLLGVLLPGPVFCSQGERIDDQQSQQLWQTLQRSDDGDATPIDRATVLAVLTPDQLSRLPVGEGGQPQLPRTIGELRAFLAGYTRENVPALAQEIRNWRADPVGHARPSNEEAQRAVALAEGFGLERDEDREVLDQFLEEHRLELPPLRSPFRNQDPTQLVAFSQIPAGSTGAPRFPIPMSIAVSVSPGPGGTFVARTENFEVTAPTRDQAEEIARYAEFYRTRLTQAWLGRTMAPWGRMPIVVTGPINGQPPGATHMTFQGGRVTEWGMEIHASMSDIRDHILPHELTHAILARHLGVPIPRLFDEGAATSQEGPGHNEALRQAILADPARLIANLNWDALLRLPQGHDDYHEDRREYPVGNSMVRFLFAHYADPQEGMRAYMLFLRAGLFDGRGNALQQPNWDNAARRYGYADFAALRVGWASWAANRNAPGQVPAPGALAVVGAQVSSSGSEQAGAPAARRMTAHSPHHDGSHDPPPPVHNPPEDDEPAAVNSPLSGVPPVGPSGPVGAAPRGGGAPAGGGGGNAAKGGGGSTGGGCDGGVKSAEAADGTVGGLDWRFNPPSALLVMIAAASGLRRARKWGRRMRNASRTKGPGGSGSYAPSRETVGGVPYRCGGMVNLFGPFPCKVRHLDYNFRAGPRDRRSMTKRLSRSALRSGVLLAGLFISIAVFAVPDNTMEDLRLRFTQLLQQRPQPLTPTDPPPGPAREAREVEIANWNNRITQLADQLRQASPAQMPSDQETARTLFRTNVESIAGRISTPEGQRDANALSTILYSAGVRINPGPPITISRLEGAAADTPAARRLKEKYDAWPGPTPPATKSLIEFAKWLAQNSQGENSEGMRIQSYIVQGNIAPSPGGGGNSPPGGGIASTNAPVRYGPAFTINGQRYALQIYPPGENYGGAPSAQWIAELVLLNADGTPRGRNSSKAWAIDPSQGLNANWHGVSLRFTPAGGNFTIAVNGNPIDIGGGTRVSSAVELVLRRWALDNYRSPPIGRNPRDANDFDLVSVVGSGHCDRNEMSRTTNVCSNGYWFGVDPRATIGSGRLTWADALACFRQAGGGAWLPACQSRGFALARLLLWTVGALEGEAWSVPSCNLDGIGLNDLMPHWQSRVFQEGQPFNGDGQGMPIRLRGAAVGTGPGLGFVRVGDRYEVRTNVTPPQQRPVVNRNPSNPGGTPEGGPAPERQGGRPGEWPNPLRLGGGVCSDHHQQATAVNGGLTDTRMHFWYCPQFGDQGRPAFFMSFNNQGVNGALQYGNILMRGVISPELGDITRIEPIQGRPNVVRMSDPEGNIMYIDLSKTRTGYGVPGADGTTRYPLTFPGISRIGLVISRPVVQSGRTIPRGFVGLRDEQTLREVITNHFPELASNLNNILKILPTEAERRDHPNIGVLLNYQTAGPGEPLVVTATVRLDEGSEQSQEFERRWDSRTPDRVHMDVQAWGGATGQFREIPPAIARLLPGGSGGQYYALGGAHGGSSGQGGLTVTTDPPRLGSNDVTFSPQQWTVQGLGGGSYVFNQAGDIQIVAAASATARIEAGGFPAQPTGSFPYARVAVYRGNINMRNYLTGQQNVPTPVFTLRYAVQTPARTEPADPGRVITSGLIPMYAPQLTSEQFQQTLQVFPLPPLRNASGVDYTYTGAGAYREFVVLRWDGPPAPGGTRGRTAWVLYSRPGNQPGAELAVGLDRNGFVGVLAAVGDWGSENPQTFLAPR